MLVLFWIVAIAVAVSAVAVVALKNPLHSALALICNLLGVACLYAMLEAHFLAAAQIIIYAGAIMVLTVFVLMLLSSKIEQPRSGGLFLSMSAVLLGTCFAAMLVPLFHSGFESMPLAGSALAAQGTAENVGRRIFTDYIFLFQAGGVLLMAALVGAVMLAGKSKPAAGRQSAGASIGGRRRTE